MAGPPTAQPRAELWPDLLVFFSFYAGLVLLLGLWSRALARQAGGEGFHRRMRRFNQVMFAARLIVPIWFLLGVWALGWGALVSLLGTSIYRSVVGLVVGTLPAFVTWMGLWWSQYPAERALREQNELIDLESDRPFYQPPDFGNYFLSNLRLQILFTLAPVAMIALLRDGLIFAGLTAMGRSWTIDPPPQLEMAAMASSAAIVFLFAPALLTRVLSTHPMPPSPLRRRLDALCRRAGVRYRQILIWNTQNHLGNAAVMGVLPRVRFVLLSDVLLEQMNDDEIEAVFAHELGHIVHRHMTWYAIFFVVLLLGVSAAATLLDRPLAQLGLGGPTSTAVGGFLISFPFLFGALSRRCERQADVYAARTLEMLHAERTAGMVPAFERDFPPILVARQASEATVGRYGAWLFSAALRRVATMNNIPISPRTPAPSGAWGRFCFCVDALVDHCNNWLHGSIPSRMTYLQSLSADPRKTIHFDHTMLWLYGGLLFALFTSVVFSALHAM